MMSNGIKNCLHLQLYRDPKDRYKKGQTKASLSLQHFLGFESGFTLDKESNTIAIICQDVTVVLAFETRERLIAWQVKVGGQLGSSKEYLVMIGGGGSRKLPAGPARLHIQGRRFALTSGVPPRLLGLWELAHLRRYGVVEGRFCFEGGSHCGKGEGLHMLITDQAQDIADSFDQAAQGKLQQKTGPQRTADRGTKSRPNTRLSDFNATDQSLLDTASALYEENYFGEDCGEISPFWPSAERRGFDEAEYRPETEMSVKPPWSGADHVTLERCNNCLTKLGGLTRSSTVALNTGGHFNPEWTMEAVPESSSDNSSNSTEFCKPNPMRRNQDTCQCKDQPPQRPPKPVQYDKKKPPAPLPHQGCNCSSNDNFNPNTNPKVGPYENYDVPKVTHSEVVDNAEYYDTPKRIKKALADDLFQVTKPSLPGSLVLKKKCGCILKFGSKKKPVIVESDESLQPVDCPCQKVTNWANTLISLPYCKRSTSAERPNTDHFNTTRTDDTAIYATVDVSRKTNRQSTVSEQDKYQDEASATVFTNYQNVDIKEDKGFEGPYANYENLEFALSLEYYENAKDLLKKAGVTQIELDALSANIDIATATLPPKPKICLKCNHCKSLPGNELHGKTDEYLLMEPPNDVRRNIVNRTVGANPGYTPMSPNPNWSQSLKHPISKVHRAEIEKSLSIPTLNGSGCHTFDVSPNVNKETMQKRSSSVDSARLLEDLKEFDSSIGSHATTSSMETLRNLALENRLASPCDNDRECYECCKSSGSENKTSEESFSKDIPHLRNKHMDNAAIKRSSSVPCKGGNRDSSSSNDSGVSSCSLKHGVGEFQEFEMPLTSGSSRYQYMVHRRMRGNLSGSIHSSLPRKSKSSDPLRDQPMQLHKSHGSAKSSSAEAEVPVLPPKQFKGVLDTHSTSSGTSDMSDYIETLSLTSSHSSSDNQSGLRISRQPTNTLRPRSGKEYHNLDPIITSMYKKGTNIGNYTNLP
ncbi:jg20749 [Pararge aegeria aegeria]|uniref:Jg20749 protein n=1 Tax=Pararge aegeria aegeria TaxID=348720 RepID=A0A8S4S7Z8_9NEOP|nr:jg20749 [Pararge aegeria aegeria]